MLLPVCLCPPQFMLFITRLLSLFAAAATTAAAAPPPPPPPPPPPHGDGMQANTRHRLLMSTFHITKPGMRSEEEDDMHKPCVPTDAAALLLSILVDDLVSLCTFLASHPLHCAYLLFFLPYLARLLSFLSPLLLSTSLLLLVHLTASSYYLDDEPPPPAPPEFPGRTCRIVLGVLKDELHGSEGADRLEQFASMFLSPIDDACPSARESAAEAVFGELFLDAYSDREAEGVFEDAEEIGGKGEIFSEKSGVSSINGSVEHPVPPNSGIGEIGGGETFSDKADTCAINVGVEHPVLPNSGIGEIGKEGNFSEADASAVNVGVEHPVPPNSGIGEIGNGGTFSEAGASVIDGGVECPVAPNSGIGEIGQGETLSEKVNASAINGGVEHPVQPNSGIREIGQGEAFMEKAEASVINEGVEHPVPPNSGIGEIVHVETFEEKAKASATDGGIELSVPPNSETWGEFADTEDAKATEKVEEDPPIPKPSRITHASSESIDSLQSYGSVKKEREWKRTLACKLYEERMTYKLCKERNADEGDEEMDLLWEAYEANASEGDGRKKKEKKKKEKANRIEHEEEEEEEEEEDEDEEAATVGQLCCLQALKLSTGKMNLGMGKKNLLKISKVLKGFKAFARSNSKNKIK